MATTPDVSFYGVGAQSFKMMKVPANVHANGALSESELIEFERKLGRQLPSDYRRLLLLANGFSGESSLLVYGIDDLKERNETWEVNEFAHGYIAIGDTGGGDVLMLSLDSSDPSVHVVGSGTMSPDEMRTIASSLEAWMSSGCPIRL